MIRRSAAVFCALLLFFSAPVFAKENNTLGMVTGPKTGTYYKFGKDIAQVGSKTAVDVDVKTSEGSIDNIKRMNSSENAALGIVQSDVLGFLARSKNPDSIKIANNLRMVFPFYNEEIHVLARKDIKTFSQLQGKKIAIGEDGSGSMLTAINLFSMMNLTPGEQKKIPAAQGVVMVLKGEIDAVIFVGGKPVRFFKNLEDLTLPENQKYAPMLASVHFIPMDSAKMLEEYKPAEISQEDYGFVTQKVPTISVQAILVSSDFARGKDKKHCETLARLVKKIREDLPTLRQPPHHPKWKEVNLDANIGIWKKDVCAAGESAAEALPKKETAKKTSTKTTKKQH